MAGGKSGYSLSRNPADEPFRIPRSNLSFANKSVHLLLY